uniref:Uncharacterized protein n=1 Tax=Pithovirus LCPAC302 TaxID=2506593 RepID=A0A481Z6Q9_9VIRU|nr:MAG: uncharacterized protein LCPAC302_01830 [Pithovirus LCPAC302]
MTDTDTAEREKYAVVIIFSRWSLGKICEFIENEIKARQDQIGVMRIDRFKGKETKNRTILLINRKLFDRAQDLGLDKHQQGLDFKMVEYELREYNFPKKDQSHNFYIPLPKTVSTEYAQSQLEDRIRILTDFGLFQNIKPRINISIVSRETGEHTGKSFITFSKNTPLEKIALAKVLFHDTRFYLDKTEPESYELMKCFWARKKKKKRKAPPNKISKQDPN